MERRREAADVPQLGAGLTRVAVRGGGTGNFKPY
jgi:hypothetical protein